MTKFKLLWDQEREKSRKLAVSLENERTRFAALQREFEETKKLSNELFEFIQHQGIARKYWQSVATQCGLSERTMRKYFGEPNPDAPPS